MEKFDDESGYPYYENQETGEMVWEKPLGFDEQGDHSAPDAYGVTTYEWVEKMDDETGYPYYESTNTGEMLWEKPEGFDEAMAAAAAAAAATATVPESSDATNVQSSSRPLWKGKIRIQVACATQTEREIVDPYK